MKNNKGFTLVELLVVISIIALLLAILMPSLNKAREIAKNTVCKSNLKQISLGVSLYANNNKDYIPLHCAEGNWWTPPPTVRSVMWFDLLADYEISAASGVLYCQSDKYPTKPSEAMIDPLNPRYIPQGRFRDAYNDGYISYRYNMHYTREGLFGTDKNYYPQKITKFVYPTRNLVIADGVSVKGMGMQGVTSTGLIDFGLEGNWNYIGSRHKRGSISFFNGLLGDMSVNTWKLNSEVMRGFQWEYPH